ncbi:hypothetical protein MGN70_010239 [Eutypa lata]|nr:hypothetical protein MGN70_010239 [Eutypa lata]
MIFAPESVQSRRLVAILLHAILADYCLTDIEDINDPDAGMDPTAYMRIGGQAMTNFYLCSRMGMRLLLRAEDEHINHSDDIIEQVGFGRYIQIQEALWFLDDIYEGLFHLLLYYERHMPGVFSRVADAI